MNENLLLSLVVEAMFNLRTFSKVIANANKIFQCSILHFEMYINCLDVEY